MSQDDRELGLRRIQKLEEALASSGRDDAHASRHAAIAVEYKRIGEFESAALWYIKAAKYAEFSERGLIAVAHAKAAAATAPNNLDARREYDRLWTKYGPGGKPDSVT